MDGRLAIHHEEGSYSDRWIEYCKEQRIPYRAVNCLDSDIIGQLTGVKGLLWNWSLQNPPDQLIARHLIMAAEAMGIIVFPNVATCWHYDDKIAQKYLLEAIDAPLVPTFIFYDLREALRWIDNASFPKVFKLRKGASSANVRLARTASEARLLAKRAMTAGFWPLPSYTWDVRRRYRSARRRGDLFSVVRRMPKMLARLRYLNHAIGRERGYIYFQEFMAGNEFDTRVTIIGNRAFAFTRNVRPGDFRASGSGDINYDREKIDVESIRIAFDVARRIGSQSLAFDFVLDGNRKPLILEVSYCYDPRAVFKCQGHWDDKLNWNQGHMWPQDSILIDLLNRIHASPTNLLARISV
jgi:hypothetical protein